MNKISDRERLEAQLDDLATGQLGPWASFRLRQRLRRDPEVARSWRGIRQLRADLSAVSIAPDVKARRRRAATFTIGGVTMKQRTAAIATGGLLFLSVTGAIASRYWGPIPMKSVIDEGAHHWEFAGRFRGYISILSPEGVVLQEGIGDGDSATSPVAVRCTQRQGGELLVRETIQGIGRHPVQSAQGKLIAYVGLSPFSQKQNKRMQDLDSDDSYLFADYYRRPERVTPNNEKHGFAVCERYPELVGCLFREDLPGTSDKRGFSWGISQPVAFKMYGEARIVAKLRLGAEQVSYNEINHGQPVMLSRRTLITYASSLPLPSETQAEEVPPEEKITISEMKPVRYAKPLIYWSLGGDPSVYRTDYVTESGDWRHVLRFGTFSGFGHFVVRDPENKYLLTFDVTPLPPSAALTTTRSPDTVRQKVVPGWDGEE